MTTPPVFDWDQIPPTITNRTGTETYFINPRESRPHCRLYCDPELVISCGYDMDIRWKGCRITSHCVTYLVTSYGCSKPFTITDHHHWFAAEVPE